MRYSLTSVKLTALYIDINTSTPSLHTHTHTPHEGHTQTHTHTHEGTHACVQSVSHQNTVITFSEKHGAHTHTHTHTLSPHATLPSPLSTYISPHLKAN